MQSKMISAFVREERINQGLTQTELADRANVSRRSINSIELEQSVRRSTIEKVVESLGYKLVVRFELVKREK